MAIYPVVSWGLVLLLGGVAVYIYKPELVQKILPAASVPVQPSANTSKSSSKKPKAKKPKAVQDVIESVSNAIPSSSDETRAKKKRKITAPVGQTVTVTTTQGETRELPRDASKDIDDKAFAQQLAKAQAGTKLQSTSQQTGASQRLTAATLQPKKSEEVLSTAELSSTTGQDADDDLSSVESPQQKAVSSKAISDMLEAPGAAPTTLRLTNVSNEPKKAKQAPKQFEQVQSKKKRNEQARREEQKRLREESDKIHEQKKQEQLRRARMAAGTSNQTKVNTFTSSSNAWQNKPQSQTSANPAPLLDTFEPSSSQSAGPTSVQAAAMSSAIPTNNVTSLKAEIGRGATSALAASSREQGTKNDWAGRMSEEEQMQKLHDQQQDDAWESVTNRKTKKKNKIDTDTSSEASFSVAPPAKQKVEQRPVPKASGVSTNGTTNAQTSNNKFDLIKPVKLEGLEDDEWAA